MSRPSNKLVVEDQLCEIPEDAMVQITLKDQHGLAVRITLKDQHGLAVSVHEVIVGNIMFKRVGSSKRKDQLKKPIRNEVLLALKESDWCAWCGCYNF